MRYLTEQTPTVRRRHGGVVVEERARALIAAEFRHTTARGVMSGDPPDPQVHSHVVVTSAVRGDGRIGAVASRPIFRAARGSAPSTAARLLTSCGNAGTASTPGPESKAGTSSSLAFPGVWPMPSPHAAVRSHEQPSASEPSGEESLSAGSCDS